MTFGAARSPDDAATHKLQTTPETRLGFFLYNREAMEQSTAALQVAVNVLEAISEKRHPDERDLEHLRQLAPLLADMPPDELACAVISQAVERLG